MPVQDRPSGDRQDTSHRKHKRRRPKPGTRSGQSSSHLLSADALAQLNELNTSGAPPQATEDRKIDRAEREAREQKKRQRREAKRREQEREEARLLREEENERILERNRQQRHQKARSPQKSYDTTNDSDEPIQSRKIRTRKSSHPNRDLTTRRHASSAERGRRTRNKTPRAVSGAIVEEGRSSRFWGLRGGNASAEPSISSYEKEDLYRSSRHKDRRRRRIWIAAGIGVLAVIIIVVVAVVVSQKNASSSTSTSTAGDSSVPANAPSYLNPSTWTDTTDFNLTYTAMMVGNLPIMGLNSTWDDSQAPNSLVPALNTAWGSYASRPARGVNLGGWLSIEPFITPDLFNYDSSLGIIDEYTLCTHLGSTCASVLEQHYATFVTESTFSDIASAGLDHVRIPYSYWAVEIYDQDPYIYRTSWRYLLRGIEWARKHGLRVNLDLHGLPGSQNGWNHSGRQGAIGWFNGTNGAVNVQRSIDVHNRLSQFFAQPRYSNIISFYGLANEPRMTYLSIPDVINWTETTSALIRANGLTKATIVFGDGFRGLGNWQGEMTGSSNLALDVHQYVIFNNAQIVFNHSAKISYACTGWTQQTEASMSTATGFGPTLVAEWSQADTDCLQYLNNVGWGNRWTGTYDTGNASDPLRALTPRCPTMDSQCSCSQANADPSQYSSDYKQFLLYFAEAQMDSFEKGWGWFYWTWITSGAATQWSYKQGMAAGILPKKAYDRTFHCNSTAMPSFSSLSETF